MSAACATHPELDWFTPADYPQAAAICGTCPERSGCEAGARARGEQWGMWGTWVADVDGDASDFMLTGFPAVVDVQVEHGTRTRRNAGCDCRRCLDAHRRYVAEWRQRGRADVTGAVGLMPEQLDLFGRTA